MALTTTQIQQLYTAYLGRPADQAGVDYWSNEELDLTITDLRFNLANDNQPEYVELYGDRTREELVTAIYQNMFGRDPEAEGLDYWVNGEGAAVPASELQQLFIEAASEEDTAAFSARVAEDESNITPLPGTDETVRLTQQADNLEGNDGVNTTFVAPVTQNETGSGQLANTFETGDVLDGGADSTNTLRADLIGTGTIQDNVQSAPISAETTNIQNVFLRAQMPNQVNTVDAEKMEGVQQWWTDNSRSNIVIEDIRTATDATTFGMRETDPGVGYTAYFNPLFLEGDTSSDSELSLVIQEIDGDQVLAANQLENITVREVNFTVGGEAVTLTSDDISAANTWDELETAIAAELEAQELEGLTISHNGSGLFVIDDAQGRPFEIVEGEALIFGAAADIDVRNRVEVGRLEQEGPTETNVVLDGAGGGSQGGALNIGALSGLRGVEVFNVTVDRDSHLTSMTSFNQAPGAGNDLGNGEPNEFLEVVNLVSGENAGDLQVGERTANSDGRASNVAGNAGLTNVREVNAEDFAGDLNIGLRLTDDATERYLDGANEAVEFNYTTGAGNDLFNVAATAAVSGDQDFAMNVAMGAGDDRLVIDVPVVRAVSVDGGEGENSIVVTQSHGTTANTTFAEFANFQTYEVEGNVPAGTEHNFTSMSGVENVIVATTGTADTQLTNLEADQNVTVSGKNQTTVNSTADQNFGIVQLTNDQGVDRTVTLENTARLANVNAQGNLTDGRLIVNNLLVDATATGVSATRELDVVSAGDRNTANVVNAVNAASVTSLNLSGTQDLSLNVATLATQPVTAGNSPALTVSGAELEGDLALAINTANLTRGNLDVLTGTAGESDTLQVYDAGMNAATVSEFETIQLGGAFQDATTTFGGTYDAANTTDAELYSIQNLAAATTVSNLGGEVNALVNAATAATNQDLTFTAGTQATGNILNVEFSGDNYTSTLATNDFRTVNIELTGDLGGTVADDTFAFTVGADAYARTLTFTGGGDQGDAGSADGVDVLTLGGALENSLTTIDFSGFVGQVGAVTLNAAAGAGDQSNTTILMNGYSATVTDTVTNQITTFRFTEDAVATTEDWTITGFRGFDDATVSLSNLSVLDLRDLGVEGLADITITDDANGTDTTITSNQGLNFEITLLGVTESDLSNENFAFAS